MIGKKALFIIIFLFFLFSSPWFLILVQNHPLIGFNKNDLIFSHNQVFIDEINTLRGQATNSDNGLLGKLIVNKATYYGQEITKRYLESFDANFLFFTGGIDKITSTGNSGQLPLSFLPLILYAIFLITASKNKSKNTVLYIFLVSPVLAIFFYKHYAWLPRILFFGILTLLATYGLTKIPKTKKIVLAILLIFWTYETANFYHKFRNHYTQKLAEQIYNIKK